ncbi:FliA/WhiG family RNA polymerase sigma factor [Candidatus Nitrospira bockiana]
MNQTSGVKTLQENWKQEAERERLIREFAPVIKAIAHRLAFRLPAHLDVDDLVSVGIMGLMDAMTKYDPTREAKFKTYAEFRIRGAMLDEIRSMDWVPRSVHERVSLLERTHAALLNRLGRPPSEEELAEALKLSAGELAELMSRAQGAVMVSLDDLGVQETDGRKIVTMLADHDHPDPLALVVTENRRALLTAAIEQLPRKERLVLTLYYCEELTMKEIGRILNVTESRVCQLHTKAILSLKARLNALDESR